MYRRNTDENLRRLSRSSDYLDKVRFLLECHRIEKLRDVDLRLLAVCDYAPAQTLIEELAIEVHSCKEDNLAYIYEGIPFHQYRINRDDIDGYDDLILFLCTLNRLACGRKQLLFPACLRFLYESMMQNGAPDSWRDTFGPMVRAVESITVNRIQGTNNRNWRPELEEMFRDLRENPPELITLHRFSQSLMGADSDTILAAMPQIERVCQLHLNRTMFIELVGELLSHRIFYLDRIMRTFGNIFFQTIDFYSNHIPNLFEHHCVDWVGMQNFIKDYLVKATLKAAI